MPRHAASSAGPRSSAVSCVGATRMVWCQTWWTSVRLRERVDTLRVPRADCEATRRTGVARQAIRSHETGPFKRRTLLAAAGLCKTGRGRPEDGYTALDRSRK